MEMTETTPLTAPPVEIIAETAEYRVRLLTPEELVSRAADLLHYVQLPDPSAGLIIVVEEKPALKIVASWMALNFIFLEGLYIIPEARGTQIAIQRLLLGGMLSQLASMGVAHPLTLTEDPAILALARKAGFTPVAGTLLKLE